MIHKLFFLFLIYSLTLSMVSPEDFDKLIQTIKSPLRGSKFVLGTTVMNNNLTVYAITSNIDIMDRNSSYRL